MTRKQALLAIFGAIISEQVRAQEPNKLKDSLGVDPGLTSKPNSTLGGDPWFANTPTVDSGSTVWAWANQLPTDYGFNFDESIRSIHFEWNGRKVSLTLDEVFDALESR